ncbi:MAG: AmmeMemoRadiSam system protein B [Candidatus Krumholzibacteria bacterium]|nr:AmmeMemoRadiSam system protein B [Candidatus Krumholzibacteria bacterium]
MKRSHSTVLILAFLPFMIGALISGSTPDAAPLSPIRIQKDTIGYATRPDQVEALVRLVDSLEASRYAANAAGFPLMTKGSMIGAICPHDDYLYAGRGYVHVMREVRAPRVILFGVSHTARRRGIQDKLIFDDFSAWKSAYGNCPVSSMREEIVAALPAGLVLVNDTIHSEEHSLEGFVPILQHYLPNVEIVPILVTRMNGDNFDAAADALAAAISNIMKRNNWKLGEDVAILVSADCVHYGDEEWGGRNYAPFGTGEDGYEKGIAQDRDVIRSSLAGTLSRDRIGIFRDKVENSDFQQPYKITWCGVYSIPFGLSVLDRLAAREGGKAPEGFMLVYGTSLRPRKLPLAYTGLGVTAIATLRHWVGYTAIGYW